MKATFCFFLLTHIPYYINCQFLFLFVLAKNLLNDPNLITDEMKHIPWMERFIEYNEVTRQDKICCLRKNLEKVMNITNKFRDRNKKMIYKPKNLVAEVRNALDRLRRIWRIIKDDLKAHDELEKRKKGGVKSLLKSSNALFSKILKEIEDMLRFEALQSVNKAYRKLFLELFKDLNSIMGKSLKCMYRHWNMYDTHVNIKYF